MEKKRVNMCNCKDNADIVMVYGRIKTYRCAKCGKEWEEKDACDLQGESFGRYHNGQLIDVKKGGDKNGKISITLGT